MNSRVLVVLGLLLAVLVMSSKVAARDLAEVSKTDIDSGATSVGLYGHHEEHDHYDHGHDHDHYDHGHDHHGHGGHHCCGEADEEAVAASTEKP